MSAANNPKLEQVLAAHTAAGWTASKPAGSASSSSKKKRSTPKSAYTLTPPAGVPIHLAKGQDAQLTEQLEGYGLATPAGACALWGVSGAPTLGCGDAAQRQAAATLWTPHGEGGIWVQGSACHAGGMSAARLAATAVMDARWTLAALTCLRQEGERWQECMTQGWLRQADAQARRAAATLMEKLGYSLRSALQWAQQHQPPQQSTLPPQAAVMLAAELDAMYYALLEHHLTCGWTSPPVPPPHIYLPAIVAAHPGNGAAAAQLLGKAAPTVGRQVLESAWEFEAGTMSPAETAVAENPLLTVMWARWQEGCRLLWSLGFGTWGEMDEAAVKAGQKGSCAAAAEGEPPPWPAHPALLAWRDGGRECHYYAFASYNSVALAALGERGPLLEIGAGTGYWAAALRRRGADVAAYDAAPPSPHLPMPNEFHGRTPAVTKVLAGGPEKAGEGDAANRTLLLCYPPPGEAMGAECLQKFRGGCVCIVGEWDGDTGSPALTAALLDQFSLAQRIPLPNWTDTAHELAIWERKPGQPAATSGAHPIVQNGSTIEATPPGAVASPGRKPTSSLPLLACATCGLAHACGVGSDARNAVDNAISSSSALGGSEAVPQGGGDASAQGIRLKRCCYCREVAYCSGECEKRDSRRHAEIHAVRLIFFKRRKLHFDRPSDYTTVRC